MSGKNTNAHYMVVSFQRNGQTMIKHIPRFENQIGTKRSDLVKLPRALARWASLTPHRTYG
jgi:hypothetical protein